MKNLLRNIVLVFGVAAALGLSLTSCQKHTCPTYMEARPVAEQVERA